MFKKLARYNHQHFVLLTQLNEMAFDVVVDVRTMLQYGVDHNKFSKFEITSKELKMHY